jgi:hypothetical protein
VGQFRSAGKYHVTASACLQRLGRINNWTLKNTFDDVLNLKLPTQTWLTKALLFFHRPFLRSLVINISNLDFEDKP